MIFISVRCPYCHNDRIVKRDKTHRGTQHYRCQILRVLCRAFYLNIASKGGCLR
jgi:transposase-like protein